MKRHFLFFFLFFSSSIFATNHPLIYMIAPPRSLSTVFLRMMHNRGDFEVYNEPSLPLYLKKNRDRVKRNYKPDLFDSFDAYSTHLLNRIQETPVFVKDSPVTVFDFLACENALVDHPNIQFVFLVRDPHATAISFYRKNIEHGIFEDMKEHFSERMGFEKLYLIYKIIESRAQKKPSILIAEDLYQNPEKELKKLCLELQIPFSINHLFWSHLEDEQIGEEIQDWHEVKDTKVAKIWHGDALKSHSFHIPRQYIKDENKNPTFEEIEDLNHRVIVKEAYEENLYFYNQMISLKLK